VSTSAPRFGLYVFAATLLLVWAFGLSPTPASAETRRIEAIGAAPIKPGRRGSVSVLDEAIQLALREAVSRVAQSFLLDADAEGESDLSIEKVLGKKMVPYTTRFRIIDDRGERPALFADDPKVSKEYVVVVEVFVDADRVEERLREAGVLEASGEPAATRRIRLEARGVTSYPAYLAMVELIRGAGGAVAVTPRGFARGIAVFDVEVAGAGAPASAGGSTDPRTDPRAGDPDGGSGDVGTTTPLLERLVAAGSPTLVIRPLEVSPTNAIVAVQFTQP
jgi:hypothetical protein